MLSFIAVETKGNKSDDCSYVNEQLQCCRHARLLSTSMPPSSKPMPMTSISMKIYHFGRSCSKTSYRGVKTNNRVPASRRASPIISSVNFFGDKVTSVLRSLSFPLGQFLVFQLPDAMSLSMVSRNIRASFGCRSAMLSHPGTRPAALPTHDATLQRPPKIFPSSSQHGNLLTLQQKFPIWKTSCQAP